MILSNENKSDFQYKTIGWFLHDQDIGIIWDKG